MPSYYFDTSALAKRYVAEVGSSWVQDICAQQSGQTIYTSVLTQPEIVSALQRRMREGIFEAYLLRLAMEHPRWPTIIDPSAGLRPILIAPGPTLLIPGSQSCRVGPHYL